MTGVNKIVNSLGGEAGQNMSKNHAKGCKNYFTRGRIMLCILIGALIWWHHLSSQISKEWKLGCSTKVTTYVSDLDGLFMASWNTEQRRDKAFDLCQLYYLICSNYFRAITISWKIVYCLAKILLMPYHIRSYINTVICTCNVVVQREIFLSLFVKHMVPWICCVFHGNYSTKCLFAFAVKTQLIMLLKQLVWELKVFNELHEACCKHI